MSKIPFFKFFTKTKFSVSNVNKYYVGVKPQPTLNCVGLIGKRSIINLQCHPELVSGSSHQQKCVTICTVSWKEVLDKVGWAFSPTMKLCWGRSPNLQKAISYVSRKATRHVRGDLVPAFTLAEVLITLGIIGVVAAMTLPTLIANGRKTETISRLKKFNSTMQQALLMAQKDYGEPKYWDKNDDYMLEDENGNPILDENGKVQTDWNNASKQGYDFVMKYIAPYIKYTKIVEENEDETRKFTAIYFQDGSIAYVKNGECIDFMFDVNGKNRPNQVGIDRFYFYIAAWNPVLYFGNKNTIWGTYYTLFGRNDRARVLSNCKNSALYCTRLIEMDGWEFKDDYPYKL